MYLKKCKWWETVKNSRKRLKMEWKWLKWREIPLKRPTTVKKGWKWLNMVDNCEKQSKHKKKQLKTVEIGWKSLTRQNDWNGQNNQNRHEREFLFLYISQLECFEFLFPNNGKSCFGFLFPSWIAGKLFGNYRSRPK